MGSAHYNNYNSLHENNLNFVIRQGVCLVSFAIHITLFWQQLNPAFWALIIFQGFIYPVALQYIPYFQRNSIKNLLIDTALYGFCLGLWGFQPYLVASYLASANIINMAAGGFRFCIKAWGVMALFAFLGAALHGFQLRMNLPMSTLTVSAAGLLFFMTSLGMRIHHINQRLRNTRNDLRAQKEELLNLNALAVAVNSHLDVDIIMHGVMQTIERIYPFEALYIVGFEQEEKRLEVSGIYGSSITEEEHRAFRSFQFDLEKDRHSLFVKGLIKRKAIYIPDITPEMVLNGAKIDRDLFAVKPSVSLSYFPVFVDDKVVAGACFINYTKRFTLSDKDLQCIQQYLVQVGTALRNAALFQDLLHAKSIAEQAQQKAETSEEAKSRFLANMSHEIRTPLTAIMGYSEALQDQDTGEEERQKFVGYILRSGKHLLSMINDILDISKIEASKINVERIPCSLLEILCDIESYLSIKTREKNLTFAIKVTYPIPQNIQSDPTRLKQILLNLCNNAVKFTHAGGIVLHLRSLPENKIEIQVQDTGIGISENEQDKVFTAFDQADTSTTRLFGGTGLGLYISKNLAQLLGGELTVTSTKGAGSTFSVTTRIGDNATQYLRTEEQFKLAMSQVKESKTYSGVPNLKGHVLVAEDNPENQNLIKRLIQQTGMSLEIVENGQKALESASTGDYTLILMDMQMPVMGGKEAAEQIVRSGNNTPIVAFTANVMTHQVDEYRAQGFCEVLEKPIIRERLFETLKRIVDANPKKPGRVLIVEDNEINQMILQRYVNKANDKAAVVIVKNGVESIEKVKEEHFDLILMDMEMPIMGGLEATKRIRGLGFETPLYIVTGNVAREDIESCIAAGANGHLSKPLNKEHVMSVIQSSLP